MYSNDLKKKYVSPSWPSGFEKHTKWVYGYFFSLAQNLIQGRLSCKMAVVNKGRPYLLVCMGFFTWPDSSDCNSIMHFQLYQKKFRSHTHKIVQTEHSPYNWKSHLSVRI